MRSLHVGIGVAFLLASAAPAVAHDPPFSWTGFYVGVNAGYSWGKASADTSGTLVIQGAAPLEVSGSRSGDINGSLTGGQIGYNWQSQRWVYGIEADFQGTGENGLVSACLDLECARASYDLDWFGTLRGRLGYLLDPRALLYLTGGLAYGHLSSDFSLPHASVGSFSISDSATRAGWIIGGGLEWALSGNWLLRAEYLYMDLGTMRTELGPISATIPNGRCPIDVSASGTVRTDFTDQIFRVGISYKFGETYVPLK
jgi:outer membrane immunogenic protein